MISFGLWAVLLAASVTPVSTTLLSPEQDAARSVSCGKSIQSKLFDGTDIKGSAAPWALQVGFTSGSGTVDYNSGFVLSPNHVVSSVDAVLSHATSTPGDTFKWLPDLADADLSSCENGVMPIAQGALDKITVHLCVESGLGEQCSNEHVGVSSGFYFGSCDDSKYSYGFVVMELAAPLPPSVVPLCITDVPAVVGETVIGFAVGYNNTSHALRTRTSTIKECEDGLDHPEISVCMNSGTCARDFGGAATRLTEGQHYVLGVLWRTSCENDGNSFNVAFAPFAKRVCEKTGICLTTPTHPTKPPTARPTLPPKEKEVEKPDETMIDEKDGGTPEEKTSEAGVENSSNSKSTVILFCVIALLKAFHNMIL